MCELMLQYGIPVTEKTAISSAAILEVILQKNWSSSVALALLAQSIKKNFGNHHFMKQVAGLFVSWI